MDTQSHFKASTYGGIQNTKTTPKPHGTSKLGVAFPSLVYSNYYPPLYLCLLFPQPYLLAAEELGRHTSHFQPTQQFPCMSEVIPPTQTHHALSLLRAHHVSWDTSHRHLLLSGGNREDDWYDLSPQSPWV